MKIIKTIIAAILFVACVFLATANMHEVDLVYPDVPLAGWPEYGPWRVPLFVVILVTLVVGILVGGLGTLFEQIRLRTAARRARKEKDRAVATCEAAEQERGRVLGEIARTKTELESVRSQRDGAVADLERLRHESAAEVEPMLTGDPQPRSEGEETT